MLKRFNSGLIIDILGSVIPKSVPNSRQMAGEDTNEFPVLSSREQEPLPTVVSVGRHEECFGLTGNCDHVARAGARLDVCVCVWWGN